VGEEKRRVKVGEGKWKAQGVSYWDFSTSKYNNSRKIRVTMKSFIIIANMKHDASYWDFSTSKYNNTRKIRVIIKSYIIIANMKLILYCLF